RLNHWLDPRDLPPRQPVRRQVRDVLERCGLVGPRGASARFHSTGEFDSCLLAAGLEKIAGRTVGFGPFSFLGWKFLSDSSGVRVHRRLQQLADRGVPILRSMGTQRSEEHTSELQSRGHLVCRLLLEKKKKKYRITIDKKKITTQKR